MNRCLRDLQEQIETLHNMETMHGTIHINGGMLRRCIELLQDGVTCNNGDHNGRKEQLLEILNGGWE